MKRSHESESGSLGLGLQAYKTRKLADEDMQEEGEEGEQGSLFQPKCQENSADVLCGYSSSDSDSDSGTDSDPESSDGEYETRCLSCGVDLSIDSSHVDWKDVLGEGSDPCDDCCCGGCGSRKRQKRKSGCAAYVVVCC